MNDSWPTAALVHTHKALLSVKHTLLSRKVPKVNLGKVQSFVDGAGWKFVCMIQNSIWICIMWTHTHTHTVWLSLWVCLVIPYHLPRQQCLSFVCLHFSFVFFIFSNNPAFVFLNQSLPTRKNSRRCRQEINRSHGHFVPVICPKDQLSLKKCMSLWVQSLK